VTPAWPPETGLTVGDELQFPLLEPELLLLVVPLDVVPLLVVPLLVVPLDVVPLLVVPPLLVAVPELVAPLVLALLLVAELEEALLPLEVPALPEELAVLDDDVPPVAEPPDDDPPPVVDVPPVSPPRCQPSVLAVPLHAATPRATSAQAPK
jgi:hypothetical protein